MGKDTFDAKSALADIKADKAPKRGRKKGSKNNHRPAPDISSDPERLAMIQEIREIFTAEGFDWLHQENPPERYTTDQLRIHVERLRQGHRAWLLPPHLRA